MSFEPVVVGFCCNECAYAAADVAGSSRMRYPANVRIIRVPCSGHVDLVYLLRAIELGADGVFVAGCLKGGCHYVDGNLKAERTVELFKRLLDALGLGAGRAEMYFMSSADADAFVRAVTSFTERVRALGPSPLRGRGYVPLAEARKRRAVAVLLRRLADALGVDAAKLPRLTRVPPQFSELSFDAESCTGCKACELSCDYGAIRFEDVGGVRRLLYSSAECTVCKACIDSCPEGAVSLSDSLDLSAFSSGGYVARLELPLATCKLCGRPFATEREVERAASKVPELAELVGWCPECRRRVAVSDMAGLVAR